MIENETKSKKLIKTGAEIIGASIGSVLGLIGGPFFSIGGSVIGIVVTKGISEFTERFLSKRERVRVGAGAGLTIIGIQEKVNSGTELRQDGFFDFTETNRSKAEELFEGILIKCKDEYEEKKIQFISNIYKNVAFDSTINPNNANQILNSVQFFSYRQLSILALIGQNIDNKFLLREKSFRNDDEILSKEIEFLLQDFIFLYSQGLISRSDNIAMICTSDVALGLMNLTLIGLDYFKLLDLQKMPENEFYFIEQLKE